MRIRAPLWILALLAAPAAAQPITPEEAVARMLAASPAVRAADADVRVADANVRAAEGARVPALVTSASGGLNERFSGTSRGVVRNSDGSVAGGVAVRYTTEIGTQIEIGADLGAAWRSVNLTPGTTDLVTIGPNYSAQATLDVRQPLLRGAGDDATLAPTRQAMAAREASRHGRDATLSRLVLETLRAYWELWYAQEAVRVQREALRVAERQLEEQRLRVERLGTAAPVDLLQLIAQRASIEEALALAETNRRTRAIELGRLIGVAPDAAPGLEAAADPPEPARTPPLERLIRMSRDASSELRALAADVEAARERLRAAADQDQPRVDLVGSFAIGGLWSDDALAGLNLPGDRPAFGGMVGLEVELPLGSSQASAAHAAARAALEAAEARYEARAQELAAELATLRAEVEAAGRQVELAAETARLAGDVARAEEQRIALGTTTPLSLITAQQSQRESELRRLRAIVDRVGAELTLADRAGLLLARAGSREAS